MAWLPRLKQLDNVAVDDNGSSDEREDESESESADVSAAPATDVQRKLSGMKHRPTCAVVLLCYSASVGERSSVMSTPVCVSVCLSVCMDISRST